MTDIGTRLMRTGSQYITIGMITCHTLHSYRVLIRLCISKAKFRCTQTNIVRIVYIYTIHILFIAGSESQPKEIRIILLKDIYSYV
nr:MAG TPA_asm: hypothetical protein [Bacteriophage sp.]